MTLFFIEKHCFHKASAYSDKIKRLTPISESQSHQVNLLQLFSNQFIEDLNKLYQLKDLMAYVGHTDAMV